MGMQPDRVKRYPRRARNGSGTLAGIIRRNFREASMTGPCAKGGGHNPAMALKASRKPRKLRGLAAYPNRMVPTWTALFAELGNTRARWEPGKSLFSTTSLLQQRPDDL